MSKIKVIVREQNILELAEDAKKGDVIDLSELTTVDSLYIQKIIEAEKEIEKNENIVSKSIGYASHKTEKNNSDDISDLVDDIFGWLAVSK